MNRIYWIPDLPYGRLGMTARPRGNDWLADEIRYLKMQGIQRVVSLLESSELRELGLQNEAQLCEEAGIAFTSFPIADRAVPENKHPFITLVKDLNTALQNDNNIVVHCRMGIGRTSLLCAAVLIDQGANPATVFELLSEVRTLEVPDTKEQEQWLRSIRDSF